MQRQEVRKAQALWNYMVSPNLNHSLYKDDEGDTHLIVSCPKFFYMEDEEFDKFIAEHWNEQDGERR